MLNQLDRRSQDILRLVIDAYLETGEPVGSRTLSERLDLRLSPATIRNIMAMLENVGLLFSPHTSAGRLPTAAGLRLFVDGLLEVGALSRSDRESLEARCTSQNRQLSDVLDTAVTHLSGLSRCAGLVVAPKSNQVVRHIEFIYLEPTRAMAIIVDGAGQVENRVLDIPAGTPASALQQASNYLNARLTGRSLDDALTLIRDEMQAGRAQIDALTKKLIEQGVAIWTQDGAGRDALIVRGQAQLLHSVEHLEDLEKMRALFALLEDREAVLSLLEATNNAQGVQIYIGAENEFFGVTGCSMVISPFKNENRKIVGAIGVIGPMRMNYARIVPMVDYTSQIVSRLLT